MSQQLQFIKPFHCHRLVSNNLIMMTGFLFKTNYLDIKSLFDKIAENKNPAKTKRDAAMLCLLLDLKLACQRIADLQYRDIKGILDGTFQGIYRYSHKESIPVKAIQCHWKTAQSLKEWIDECRTSFGWTYDVSRFTQFYFSYSDFIKLIGTFSCVCSSGLLWRGASCTQNCVETGCNFKGFCCPQVNKRYLHE